MNDDSIFDVRELDYFAQDLLKMAEKEMPKKTSKFLKTEGNKLKRKTAAHARKKTKKKTGNYYKGIKDGKVYNYQGNGGKAIRVYGGKPSHHAHLLEYGHVVKKKKRGAELGFAEGLNIFEEARKEFTGHFYNDIEIFLEEVAKEI